MKKIESFELDHNLVVAPYVRKAKVININPEFPECVVSTFDVRFAQPNQEFIPSAALHTLEHLLAIFVRDYTDDLIDISPMGCRTGFYFVFGNHQEVPWVAALVRKALQKVLQFTGSIPGATPKECGNYLEHDLESAKIWAQKFLDVPDATIINIYR